MDGGASKEFESNLLNTVIRKAHDKDVDDLIEEVNNLAGAFKELKNEMVEDLCQVVGLYMDKYAMDQYEKGKQKQ